MSLHDRVLVVGERGGGTERYMNQQHRELSDEINIEVYWSFDPVELNGVVDVLRYLYRSIVPILLFPFRRPPTIVHVHTSHQFSFYRMSIYVFIASLLWHRPVMLHIHGSSFDEFVENTSPLVRRYQSFVFGRCDRIIVLAETWAQIMEPYVEPSKLQVVPNAVDPDLFPSSYDADPPHIVFLSGLIERKGIREFLNAITRLSTVADRKFVVSIAGDGPLWKDVARLAANDDAVTYLGYVSEGEKRALLHDASIFVLPTHAEGLPIALLEAMAAGNAVITTPVGSIPEFIDEDNGVLVTPGDVDELTEALMALVSDPATVEAMGRANRKLVEKMYSWSVTSQQLLEMYDSVRPQDPPMVSSGD